MVRSGCVCQSFVDEQACSRMRGHTGFRLGGFSIPPQSQSMELGRVGGQEPYRNRTSFFIALQNSVQLSPPDSSESRICSGKSRVGFQRDEGRGHEGDSNSAESVAGGGADRRDSEFKNRMHVGTFLACNVVAGLRAMGLAGVEVIIR